MTILPFSKEEQVKLLLARKLFAEIEKLFPNTPDSWKMLTITKSDVLDYLRSHSDASTDFFGKAGFGNACPNWHDVPAVWKEGSLYRVAWLEHGKPINGTDYPTLDEAIANYISLRYLGV